MIKEFEDVRYWKALRGIGADESQPMNERLQSQFQRVMQEIIEIHDALVKNDDHEFKDAIGDSIVTLINIAAIKNYNAEDCLEQAYGVIKLRKGLTSDSGDFVRYAKLNDEDKLVCDNQQGNPGNEYFDESNIGKLSPESFLK